MTAQTNTNPEVELIAYEMDTLLPGAIRNLLASNDLSLTPAEDVMLTHLRQALAQDTPLDYTGLGRILKRHRTTVSRALRDLTVRLAKIHGIISKRSGDITYEAFLEGLLSYSARRHAHPADEETQGELSQPNHRYPR